ncbi:MAG TPA: glycosyltransferase family 9 protein, partial [bacterium]|nr:glycosyltransferase family 9 protein [bacterium]
VKKILLIGTSCLGDNLLLTPAMKILRDAFKKAEIELVVGPAAREFAHGHPWFSRYYLLRKNSPREWFHSLSHLRKTRYDLVVDFRNSLLPFLLRARYRMTFFWAEFHSDKIFTHESERTVQLLKPFFNLPEKITLHFPVNPSEGEAAEKLLKSLEIKKSDVFVCLNPGASFPGKRWPLEKFAQTGRQLIEEYEARIGIIGGAAEKTLAAELALAIGQQKVVNLAGTTSVRELAALLERCDLLVTNDTGPMHLAVAVGCPVVAIYGPGNPYRYGPIGPKNQVVHGQVSCFPCQRPVRCRRDFTCIKTVEVEQVMKACRLVLDEGKQLYLFDLE